LGIKIIGGATSRTLRAHWAAHELALDYESVLIGSRTGATQEPDFIALNAKEKIPVLVHDDLVLTESGAIVAHLARTGGALIPLDTNGLAKYDEWQSFILMELDAQCLYIMRKHRDLPHLYGEAPGAVLAAQEGFNKQVKVAETQLATTPYLLGDEFSGVDILLGSTLAWAIAYGFSLSEILQGYLQRTRARPAFKSANAHNFSIEAGA